MTSHAAVIARGMGTPCVSGLGSMVIDYVEKVLTIIGRTIREGEIITIDGTSGEVIKGEVPTIQPDLSDDFAKLMQWVDGIRTMGVRANVDTPSDARTAREFGAEGIACVALHMFFDPYIVYAR